MTEPNNNDKKSLIDELPLKQQLFVKHYINKDGDTFQNGKRSAIASKYSEKSAHNTASSLLRNSKIKAAIQEGWDKLLSGLGLSRGYVIAGIMHNQQKLREQNDFKGAEVCTKDLGQTLALFSERLIVEARETSAPEQKREDMTLGEQARYDAEMKAIKKANEAYKLSMVGAGLLIEQGRADVVSETRKEVSEAVFAELVTK